MCVYTLKISVNSKRIFMSKYCAYIVGDKNIIYPAIVTLMSIRRFHPKDIDLFILTETQFANKEQFQICQKNNIQLIDINVLSPSEYLADFTDMKRWPVEIFLNYMAPVYLNDKSYDYAIKLDYDMLCISPFDFNKVTPNEEQIISVITKRPLTHYLEEKNIRRLEQFINHELAPSDCACNVGTIVIDLKKYCTHKLHILFADAYKIMTLNKIKIINGETEEQFCFGLLQSMMGISFKRLPEAYNFRPGVCFTAKHDATIIHYSTVFKPWADLNMEQAVIRTKAMNFSVISQIIFFNMWIEFCNTIDFKQFIRRTDLYNSTDLTYILRLLKKEVYSVLENKRLLTIYIEKIKDLMDIDNYKIAEKTGYLQIYVFNAKEVHYEIILLKDKVKVCLHMEKDYMKQKDVLNSIKSLDVFENVKFVNDYNRGELCYEIHESSDYDLIAKVMIFLISSTKEFLINRVKDLEVIKNN